MVLMGLAGVPADRWQDGNMSLPIFNTQTREFSMMQTQWSSQLNPVISNSIVNGRLMKNVQLTTGSNSINHLLDRNYQGYFITGMHGAFIQIYDTPSPSPTKTIVLNASAPGSLDLWVF